MPNEEVGESNIENQADTKRNKPLPRLTNSERAGLGYATGTAIAADIAVAATSSGTARDLAIGAAVAGGAIVAGYVKDAVKETKKAIQKRSGEASGQIVDKSAERKPNKPLPRLTNSERAGLGYATGTAIAADIAVAATSSGTARDLAIGAAVAGGAIVAGYVKDAVKETKKAIQKRSGHTR
jgi:hypothetical protein